MFSWFKRNKSPSKELLDVNELLSEKIIELFFVSRALDHCCAQLSAITGIKYIPSLYIDDAKQSWYKVASNDFSRNPCSDKHK